jgi:F0F1-type ATP synthase membrane subunit a
VWHDSAMNWIFWLGLAVLVTAVAAITGIKAKGTRPVANSRLMGVGRFILLLLILVFAYFAFRARSGS